MNFFKDEDMDKFWQLFEQMCKNPFHVNQSRVPTVSRHDVYCSKCNTIGRAEVKNDEIVIYCHCVVQSTFFCRDLTPAPISFLVVPKTMIKTEGRNQRAHLRTHRCTTFGVVANEEPHMLLTSKKAIFQQRVELFRERLFPETN